MNLLRIPAMQTALGSQGLTGEGYECPYGTTDRCLLDQIKASSGDSVSRLSLF